MLCCFVVKDFFLLFCYCYSAYFCTFFDLIYSQQLLSNCSWIFSFKTALGSSDFNCLVF